MESAQVPPDVAIARDCAVFGMSYLGRLQGPTVQDARIFGTTSSARAL